MKPETAAAYSLLSAAAVRERAHRMLAIGLGGRAARISRVDLERLDAAADLVVETTRAAYPDARRAVPCALAAFRGRRRAIAGPRSTGQRAGAMRASARARPSTSPSSASCSTPAPGRAGAIATPATGASVGRSEGLALASLAMFAAGAVLVRSAPPAARRRRGAAEPDRRRPRPALPGDRRQSAGRARGPRRLLRRLGATVAAKPDLFARVDDARPGGLFDSLAARSRGGRLPAPAILDAVLRQLGPDLAGAAGAGRRAARRLLAPSGARHGDATTGSCRCTSCRSGWPIR